MTPAITQASAGLQRAISAALDIPFHREDQDAIYAVGRFLYEQQQAARAAEVFRLLALVAPERCRSWTALAACHEALGDVDRARDLYRLALEVAEQDDHRATAAVYKARLDLDNDEGDAARLALETCDPTECPDQDALREVMRRLRGGGS